MSCANAQGGRGQPEEEGGCRSRLFRGSVIVFLAGEGEGARIFRHTPGGRGGWPNVEPRALLLHYHIILGQCLLLLVMSHSSSSPGKLPNPVCVVAAVSDDLPLRRASTPPPHLSHK